MSSTFDHPLFADDQSWHGCTTEKLDWRNPDYDVTAGTVAFRATTQPDSTAHLFFVDLVVRTNDGREIVLERVEGGKILSSLLRVQDEAQEGKQNAVYYVATPERR